jgi:hypothetical protein
MPPHKSYYDGDHEFMHTVKRGESLSNIAAQYKFKSWQTIWLYNTELKKMLDPSGDPGKIAVGEHLFIPRSEKGYEKLLKKLEVLKEGLVSSGESQMYQLESLEDEYKAEAVLFDLAGDVATLVGSLGAKAFQVARLREGAVGLKGAQRFAHEIKLNEAVKDLAEAMSKKELGKAAVDGAAGAVANSMEDEDRGENLKRTSTFGLKTAPKFAKAASAYRSRQKLSPALRMVKGGSALLDAADMALDYIKVSNVANGVLRLWRGETVDGSLQSARESVQANISRGVANLHEKILRIQRERDLLYTDVHPAGGISDKRP